MRVRTIMEVIKKIKRIKIICKTNKVTWNFFEQKREVNF